MELVFAVAKVVDMCELVMGSDSEDLLDDRWDDDG